MSKNHPLIKSLKEANYKIEDAFEDPKNTFIVEFPIDVGKGVRTLKEVSMWEQLLLASFLQKYWADNRKLFSKIIEVSCTISFDPEKEGNQIENALNYFQYHLKGISFLPRIENVYQQMPYEEITEEKYRESLKKLKSLHFNEKIQVDSIQEKYCDSSSCEI
jgi:hypothetical protein